MPIYTRTGDQGSTSLFGGKRVHKSDKLVDTYGSIDELNSWVGLVVSDLNSINKSYRLKKNSIDSTYKILNLIQSDLLTLGSNFAGWKTDLKDLQSRVYEMEKQIDWYESKLPKLNNFILPGGNSISANIHITRNITRRVERQIVSLNNSSNTKIDSKIIKYINRLSDLFFDMARYINNITKTQEHIWVGIKRTPRINKSK